MSDFEYEQAGSVEPPEPAAPEPAPVEAGPFSPTPTPTPSPSQVTAAFAEEARRLEGETLPTPAAAPEQPPPVEPQAPAPGEPPFPDQQAFEAWLQQQVEAQAQERALAYVQEEIGDLVGLVDDETLGELVQLMPEEVQEALQRRGEQIEETLLLQDIGLADARVDKENALRAEGSAKLNELVAGWQAAAPGAPEVDPAQVFEAVVEQWPDISLRIGESPEIAEGLLRQAWEHLATEQIGERRAFGLIEDELRRVGVEPDPNIVLGVKQLADQLWPELSRRNADEQQAVQETIAAAAGVATGFREPQSSKAITSYYAAKARAIRASTSGHRDGDPSLRPSGSSLPSQVTARYAREAAAIRDRSGLS